MVWQVCTVRERTRCHGRGVHALRDQGQSLELVRARSSAVLIRGRGALRLRGCMPRLRCLGGGARASACGL